MSIKDEPRKFAHSFIAGKTVAPFDATGGWEMVAPYQTDIKLARAEFSYPQIDFTLSLTKEKVSEWSGVSLSKRKELLLQSFNKLKANKELLLKILMTETGRPAHDIDLEWKEVEKFIAAFVNEDFVDQDPRGIVAVIGSYIWPIYHSLRFTSLAFLAGNAVILKPSEKTVLTVLAFAEIFSQDAIKNVFHALVGEKEFSRRLACHELVNCVIFMGSYEGGIRIKQDTLHQTQKEILLYLGAKNASIVCKDAPSEALTTLIEDTFLSAGQNCKSISQIFVHHSLWHAWIEQFHGYAKLFKIGAPDSDSWMGALIDESMVDRYLKFGGIAEREGATLVMRGKVLVPGKKSHFVTPTLAVFEAMTPDQAKKSVTLQSEILSPHVSLVRYQDEKEVVALANQSHYGLCASVWSNQEDEAKRIAAQLEVGEVHINSSTLKYTYSQSFQAKKKSGNHAYQGLKLFEQLGLSKTIQN